MPEFDKNLNPVLENKSSDIPVLPNLRTPYPNNYGSFPTGPLTSGKMPSATDQFFGAGPSITEMLPTVSVAELSANRRYSAYNPYVVDIENQKAYAQSNWDKAANGIVKGLGYVATGVIGIGGLAWGGAKALYTGELTDVFNNGVTQKLKEFNDYTERELPNYQTAVEKNANWYSSDKWFKTNFLFDGLIKNAGYGVGAVLGGKIIAKGLLAAGARIAGISTEVATAAEASNYFKTVAPILRNTARAFSIGKNVEAAQILEKEISSIADVTERASALEKISQTTNMFGKINQTGLRAGIAFFSQAGEASVEALQTGEELKANLIEQYKASHGGIEPMGEDLKNIENTVKDAGLQSFFGNMAILGITEYVQLPKLIGSGYASQKAAANEMLAKVGRIGKEGEKYIEMGLPTTRFGKLTKAIGQVGKYVIDPKEGVQEGLQYALQVGTENYYNKKYQSKDADFWTDVVMYGLVGRDEKGEGKGALVSDEGWTSIVTGAITGGLMQAKANIRENRDIKANTKAFLESINNAPTFKKAFEERLAAANRGVVLQQQEQAAIAQGDKLEAKDLETDQMHNYLAPRIKYGRFDMVMGDIEDLKKDGSTKEGLAQLVEQGYANKNDTVQSYQARLANFERVAKATNDIYNSYNLRFAGETIQDEDGNMYRKYSDEVIDKMVYAASKIMDYDYRIPQVSEDLVKLNIGVQGVVTSMLSDKDSKALDEALGAIDALENSEGDKLKKDLIETVELSKRRKLFLNELNEMKESPLKFEPKAETIIAPLEPGEEKEKIKVKTKDGEEDVEVGTEYYLGRRVFKDPSGKDYYSFPRLTILADNGDGTIKIKGSDGVERDVPKEVLAEYKLGKVSDVANNKTANFFLQHINDIYQYNFGKDFGGKVRGRLEYDSKNNKLYFAYLDKNGNIKRKEVDNSHFVPNEGYKDARIKKVGAVQAETAEQRIAREAFTSAEELALQKEKLEAKFAERRRIVKELVDETNAKIEEVDKKIVSKKEELSKINEELNELREVKAPEARTKRERAIEEKYPELSRQKIKFSKVLSTTTRAVSKLSTLKANIEKEIEELQAQKDELEFNVSYFDDFMSSITELPENFREMLSDLKSQVANLEDLSLSTGSQINQFSKMIDDINSALKDLASLLKSSFEKFNKDYPDYIQKNFNQMMENPLYEQVKELKEYISDFVLLQDTSKEIAVNENKIEEIRDKIAGLYKNLDEIGKEQRAKEKLVSALESTLKKYEQEKAEQEALSRRQDLIDAVIGTMNKDVQNPMYDRAYEADAHKSEEIIPKSSTFPTARSGEEVPEHYKRANRFGARLPNLPNSDTVRAALVTIKNQGELIPGLVQFLAGGKANVDPSTTIALVIVQPNEDGKLELVDENGKVIAEKSETESAEDYVKRLHNSAIFQTMPLNLDKQFREGTSEETKKAIIAEYNKFRTELLDSSEVKNYGVSASFGIPDKITYKDENGVDREESEGNTSVADSGLIKESDLKGSPVIYVPTLEENISLGSTSFQNALGRVFLRLKNGYVKLNNRRHNAKEASAIFDAIRQLAVNADTKSPQSLRLLEFLRSVTYWGSPKEGKDAGYSSVWFDKSEGGLKLFISGKTDESGNYIPICDFTPMSIDANKENILTLLQNIYSNTRSVLTDSRYDERFEQIISINKDGEIVSKTWPNYQTYLLSNKDADGKTARKSEDIPLTTRIRPLANEQDVNKKGVYFILADSDVDERFMNVIPKKETKTIVQAPSSPRFKLDGTTEDSYSPKTGGVVTFVYDPENPDTLKEFAPTDEAIKGVIAFMESQGKTIDEDKAINMLGAKVLAEVKLDLQTFGKKEALQAAQQVAPQPIATQYNLDGKTENIYSPETGGVVIFVYDSKNPDVLVSFAPTDEALDGVIKKIQSEKNITLGKPEAQNLLGAKLINELKAQIAPQAQQAAPVSDIEAKKAAIEKERQEDLELLNKAIYDSNKWEFPGPTVEKINAKYDAELAALEGTTAPTVTPTQTKSVNDLWDNTPDAPDNPELRVVIENEIKPFEKENWSKVEEFLKKNFPNVPVFRVKNILKGTNGLQAWGMLKNGALYIYENAEVGTAYHEIFEAVWKMFADPKEISAIRNEFRNRSGEFIDRPTGRKIKYSEATDQEIKEQLAEEFRDYVKDGKVPVKPVDGRPFIVKLFSDIVTFVRNFFTGSDAKSNTERLFEKIGTGYYKTYIPYESALSYAKAGIIDIENAYITDDAELSTMPGLTVGNVNDIMQQMTFLTLGYLQADNQSLFNIPKIPKGALYQKIETNLRATIKSMANETQKLVESGKITQQEADYKISNIRALFENVVNNWEDLKERHEIYLKKYDVSFDENDEVQVKEENRNKTGEYDSPNKIDNFRKMGSAVKMVLATLPVMDNNNKPKLSSIGGVQLLPLSETYISLMNNVHDSVNVDKMLESIRQMAISDNNYKILYKRLTKVDTTQKINWNSLQKYDAQLLTAFSNTLNKQNADVKILNIFPNGEVQVMESNLSTAARQLKFEFTNNMKEIFKDPNNKYFVYNKSERAYVAKKDVAIGDLTSIESKVKFLENLGISFNAKDIKNLERTNPMFYEKFKKDVIGIRDSILNRKKIANISGKILDIDGRLLSLATIKAKIENPEFSSTFFNVSGERVQTYMNSNPSNNLFRVLEGVPSYESLASAPGYAYLYTDPFTQHSVVLNAIFNIDPNTKTGKKKTYSDGREYMKTGIADGLMNQITGKDRDSASLLYNDRLLQEINMNLEGYYYNLVAGDAGMEYMTYVGNHVTVKDVTRGDDTLHDIFKGYFIDEVNLARQERSVVKGRKSKDLRFFKDILDERTHDLVISNTTDTAEKIYEDNIDRINSAVDKFIKSKTEALKNELTEYKVINKEVDNDYSGNLKFFNNESISEENLNINLKTVAINYAIANIEFHKLIYSDPYQYSDELKRIKNFLSPRMAILSNSSNMNSVYNRVYNEGFSEKDPGFTNFTKDYFKSTTLEDVEAVIDIENYDSWEEGDGGGMITLNAMRNMRIRANDWSDDNEVQFKFDSDFEKLVKSKASQEQIKKFLEKNPSIKSTYTTKKPIVSGSKNNGKDYNDVMLDKFALYPLSFRVLYEMNPESNAIRMYDKMRAEDIDYVVFKSARKVGAEKLNSVYNDDGSFNTTPFEGVMNVPFSIMGIQSEVPSKDDNLVTRGTQPTKLMTLDFMEAGVPIDFDESTKDFGERFTKWNLLTENQKKEQSELYKEIANNQEILENIMDEGYNNLLNKLGIEDKNGKFKIVDFSKTAKTLRDEIFRNEVNDNIISSIKGFENADVVIEATPAYQQVRYILYSMLDKNVISPKISGGQKIQIPSTLLESVRAKKKTINGKTGYTSDVLDFYSLSEDGKTVNVCEIMVGRWFESNKTDEELMDYFNNTEEGQKELAALSGIAFRVPNQKQNSTDVFKIKKFLPKEFGDNVVIPSALVKKVGSDFDIDKLFIYFKNLYNDAKGNLKVVPFLGYGEEAKNKFEDMFYDMLQERIDQKEAKKLSASNLQQLFSELSLGETTEKTRKKWIPIFKEMFKEDLVDGKLPVEKIENFFMEKMEKIGKDISNLTDYDVQKTIAEEFKNKMYKQSLENAYIQSSENLVKHPKNFERLIVPNSADQLKGLAKTIIEKTNQSKFDSKSLGNMLDRTFMSKLREAFVKGKYAIGIGAISQTNHSQNQRSPIYLDASRLSNLDERDIFWITGGTMRAEDMTLKFEKFNTIVVNGKTVPTLSKRKDANNKYFISDINGQFIDGYVDVTKDGPWIMQLGATPNVAGVWLLLNKFGVPIDEVAYFMNQPIIRDFMKMVETSGSNFLFKKDFVDELMDDPKYKTSVENVSMIPNKSSLLSTLGVEEFTSDQKAEQQFMLKEFLKYAKMAEQLLSVTQGSNFDTASLNDPYLIERKQYQLEKARKSVFSAVNRENSVISAVDSILNSSFIGRLSTMIDKGRDAIAEILKSDKPMMRSVITKVLEPYMKRYMSDKEFLRIGQRVVNDFFDWAVQLDNGRNLLIENLLISDNNAPKEIQKFKESIAKDESHPLYDNYIIGKKGILTLISSDTSGVNNLSIKNKDNKVYDQDRIIYSFREIRDYLKSVGNLNLYKKMVGVSILQSGISTTPYSFTSLIPYEDFKEIYNEVIARLENGGYMNMEDFYKLGVFERNNAKNSDIVPYEKARIHGYDYLMRPIYNLNMSFKGEVSRLMSEGKIPKLVKISKYSQSGMSDYVVYSWEDVPAGRSKSQMAKDGDFSFIKRGLFKKVYMDDDRKVPAMLIETSKKGKVYENYVYKMINAWGDGFKANEFYDYERPSVINNGFEKVEAGSYERVLQLGGFVERETVYTSPERPDSDINYLFSSETPIATTQATTADQEALKSQIDELENKKKTTGLSPAEIATLTKLQTELGKIIKSQC